MLCIYSESGECAVAAQIKHQAEHGSPYGPNVWDRENWESLINKSQSAASDGSCSDPEQLEKTINEVNLHMNIIETSEV